MEKIIDLNIQESIPKEDASKFASRMKALIDEADEIPLASSVGGQLSMPRRKMRKPYRMALAVACCAAVFAIGVTGMIMQNVDPYTHMMNPAIQGEEGETNGDNGYAKVETETKAVTDSSVTHKENDITDLDTATIAMAGGAKETNYRNPTSIGLEGDDIQSDTASWQIREYKQDTVLYEGKGTVIDSKLESMIAEEQTGNYIVTFEYKDREGNQITVHEGFTIKKQKPEATTD